MNNTSVDNGIWLDPSGLQQLRHQAASDQQTALQSAAEQFEAQFVTQMLKAMRETVPDNGLMSGRDEELYQGLMDRQLALHIARGEGFGLADSITRQMTAVAGDTSSGPEVGSLQAQSALPLRDAGLPAPSRGRPNADADRALLKTERPSSLSSEVGRQPGPQTPAAFVREIMPYAKPAGRELGIAPEILVAQAALETGWGQQVIRHANGRSSYNFFNIKAHGDWQGDAVARTTFEYSEGIPHRVRDRFRAYDSPQAAFADYVSLVSTQPRYAVALEQSGDPRAYMKALQAGGYATDPQYADKVLGLLDHPAIQGVGNAFKNDDSMPTNTSATGEHPAATAERG
mgnify:CR=1 FL=1